MHAECAVGSSASDTVTQPVEVSGWDAEGQFFVEIADLDLSDPADATVRLCHRVHSGSLVFVRLVHEQGWDAHEKDHPMANEAHATGVPDPSGRCRIRLTPCQPRATRRPGDQTRPSRI
jgi:hypothetical protein